MKNNNSDARKHNFKWGRLLIYMVLIAYTVFLFAPLVTILLTSFMPTTELAQSSEFLWWSKNMSMDAYKAIFSNDFYADLTGLPGFLLGFINTLWMTCIPLLIGLFMSSLAAYSFSKVKFPHSEAVFRFSVILSSIPLAAFDIISYVFYSNIGWTGDLGFLPLIIPGMFGSVGTVFFLRLYFDAIPTSLVEAAKLDGAGFFDIFFRIMLPLAKPALISQFIFGFVGGYNNFVKPQLYLQNQPKFVTIQLYLSQIQTMFPDTGSNNIYCAAAILGILPLIVIYCILQKYFISGIAAGAVKE